MNAGRIGLFGGTFNPIHLGHLRAAEEVREALDLGRVLFIPSHTPPHKDGDENDRIEIDREGLSYLVDTLRAIRDRETGRRKMVFILGEDAYAEMGDWRDPAGIFGLTDLAVMTRPPGQLASLADRMPSVARELYTLSEDGQSAVHREAGTRIDLVPISALDISSSKVREACRAGRSMRFLVPETIREPIEVSERYGPPPLGNA